MSTSKLPDALATALGRVVADVRREWQIEASRQAAEHRAFLADLRAKVIESQAEIKGFADQQIKRIDEALDRVKDGEPGAPGKDGIDGTDGRDGRDGTDGLPGKSVEIDDVRPVIEECVQKAVAAIPIPRDGIIDRSGVLILTLSDGTTRELGTVMGKDGKDGKDGEKGEKGERGEPGERGPAGEKGEPGATGEKGEKGEHGDRGERGEQGPRGEQGEQGLMGEKGIPGQDGKDGRDGFGFEDMTEELADDGRTIVRRYTRGDEVKEFTHRIAVVIDRGVFKEGRSYRAGDGVTWGRHYWIAREDTDAKPEPNGGPWRLAVKSGRDGKDGKDGERGPPGPKGEPGRDLTQMTFDGKKY